jgi:hypothetical protein
MRSTAIGGTYAPAQDQFAFYASTTTLAMTAAFVSSSSIAPNAMRFDNAVATGGADRVAIVSLGPGRTGPEIPLMLAFSLGGVVRAATVADARSEPFMRFNAYSPTSTTVQFDRVTIKKKSDGAILMAHRAVTAAKATLVVRTNTTAQPGAFAIVPIATPLSVGANVEILPIPAQGGGEEFALVYEAADQGGHTDVLVLRLADYGRRAGVAPLGPDAVRSRNLEDVGLVKHGQQTWIAIATRKSTQAGDQLEYTEIATADLAIPDNETGFHPGTVLDTTPMGARARLGCKLVVSQSCPIVWLGPSTDVVFVHR